MESDEQILARFLEGEEEAFEELVRRHESGLRNVAFGFVRDRALAEDVVQDAFIRAYQKASTIRSSGSIRGWLYRVAINRAQDELRRIKRKREVAMEETLDPTDSRPDVSGESVAISRELQKHLNQALGDMRNDYRTPLVLREVQGMTYTEIAELLGWPLGTVQTRIHRGRVELRANLKKLRGTVRGEP
jgi:RNA polymerase sigma-70 factor (ECF subfamily)